MKRTAFFVAAAIIISLSSCGGHKNIPDVSGIKVSLDTLRFEKDLFTADTVNMEQSLDKLEQKYPEFIKDFLFNLLGLPPAKDSVLAKIKLFIHDYKPVYDTITAKYPGITTQAKEISHALQFVTYYFPKYKMPESIVTFAGPVEGYASVLTSSGFAIGLQLYLGQNYQAYNTDYIADTYPAYRSRRFRPEYISVDCIKLIVSDIYPPSNATQPLVYQMVEAGKRLYALDAFMPETADTLKTGYNAQQLEGCYENETRIWNFFVQNNLLYATDPGSARDYMNDGPKTETLGEQSPGFIGQFVGWQIVKKWMEQDPKRTLPQLLQTPAKQVFEEAKYKPNQ